ncbi:DUF4292 domain-containing protein [Bacteroides reticulotermitis]|uniref:DUF4292 domain-containing protein n=1 Tax=Bacteroides reticulotermitis TaxID=1133319 RepID=UPI001DAEEC32|nr:DUF4292 domain-containing protein [Bacteroides reticulotermitis]
MRRVIYLLLAVLLLAGCKSSKHLAVPETEVTAVPVTSYLSSKLRLTIPNKGSSMDIAGTMKMKSRECVQISLLMPIFRSEVARIEITPDEVLLVDRMNKRYVRTTKEELKTIFPKNAEFSRLEKLLTAASLPGGRTEFTGSELGIPALEKAKVLFYDFSSKEFAVSPTELTSRYTQVPLEDLIKMLMVLL